MPNWILTGNGNGVFCADDGNFVQKGISDGSFDLLDLLNGLVMIEAIEEEVDIGSGTKLLVVVLPQLSLGGVELVWNRQEAVDDRGAGSHNVAPVKVDKRRL
jgi:hypothetical protein